MNDHDQVTGASSRSVGAFFRTPRSVFWTFLLVYLITWGGHYTTGDGAIKVAWAKAIMTRFSSDLDPGLGTEHAIYGIGHSLIAIPPLALAQFIKTNTGVGCEGALYTLIFVLNGALFLYLVARYLWRYYPPRAVWSTVSIMGLATYWWPYTKLDLSEPLVLTVFFAGFLLMRSDRVVMGMVVAGLAGTIRQDGMLLAGLLGLWQLWRKRDIRDAWKMGLALIPAATLHAIANYSRYGSLFSSGYQGNYFSSPLLAGAYGILFSPGKSIFLFSPPLILGCVAWKRFLSHSSLGHDARLFLSIWVGQLYLYSTWCAWSSDDAWGVRFLIPGVLLMTIPIVELASRRWSLVVVAIVGVMIQLPAIILSGLDYVLLVRTEPITAPAIYGFGGAKHLDMEDMWYHPRYCQMVGQWNMARTLVGIPPKPQDSKVLGMVGKPLYDLLPAEVWQRHCRWDFIWMPRK